MSKKVLFIGLGNMGLPMARNLLRAGYAVTGLDVVESSMAALQAAGGIRCRDFAGAVRQADAVITMLPSVKHVEEMYSAKGGIFDHASKSSILVDSSTVSPELSRRLAAAASERQLSLIDAPVSGGTNGATAGTLTFMVGGTAEALEQARPFLTAMGKAIYHAGTSGCGQTVKLCNNMLLGISMIGTAEALRLGQANGISQAVLSEIMTKSSGNNWVLHNCNPCPGVMPESPATKEYSGGFGVDLMLKDLSLAVESALSTQSSIPLGALARSLYDMHSKAGAGKRDFGSIYQMLGREHA